MGLDVLGHFSSFDTLVCVLFILHKERWYVNLLAQSAMTTKCNFVYWWIKRVKYRINYTLKQTNLIWSYLDCLFKYANKLYRLVRWLVRCRPQQLFTSPQCGISLVTEWHTWWAWLTIPTNRNELFLYLGAWKKKNAHGGISACFLTDGKLYRGIKATKVKNLFMFIVFIIAFIIHDCIINISVGLYLYICAALRLRLVWLA